MAHETDPALHERTLAKPLVQGGEELQPGATVRLRQDQIDRLEPDGYFGDAAPKRGGRKTQ